MENKKIRVLCVYPQASLNLRSVAERLAGMFGPENFLTVSLPADRVEIPQVNGSEIVLFGIDGGASDPDSGGYGELMRALSGMNLAGKVAGILSAGDSPGVEMLRQLLQDADAALIGPVYLEETADNTNTLQELQKRIVLSRKEMIDAGKQFS